MDSETPTHATYRGLLARAAFAVAAAAAPLAAAPAAIAAPLAIVAAAAVAERVARHRRRGPADLVLVALAGAFGVTILLGFVLNALPSGLTTTSWAVGVFAVELGGLACCVRPSKPPSLVALLRTGRRPSVAGLVCAGLGTLVLAATISVSAAVALDSAPAPLEISTVSSAGGTAQIRIDAGATTGRYVLDVVTGRTRQTVIARLDLAAGASTTATVPIPPGARSTVELRAFGAAVALRHLILDRSDSASGTSLKGPA
jgi:hypothetical protein